MSNSPKVSFGFINCNRLHYLKSCLESFLRCTEDYPNKEIIVVDNASTEEGTDEYIEELKEKKQLSQKKRNKINRSSAKAKETERKFALDKSEIENIFDIIEKEQGV